MAKNDKTAALIDGILRLTVISGALTAGLLIPNLLIGLDKPLEIFAKKLDKRARERELRRVVTYMKSRGLIKEDYRHGLVITERGRDRLSESDLRNITIKLQKTWDKNWRVVLYDIPEDIKSGRDALIKKLRNLGFYQLQRSVWLHPFPCRSAINQVAVAHKVDKYVSYIKTGHIDRQEDLVKRFSKRYPETKFN